MAWVSKEDRNGRGFADECESFAKICRVRPGEPADSLQPTAIGYGLELLALRPACATVCMSVAKSFDKPRSETVQPLRSSWLKRSLQQPRPAGVHGIDGADIADDRAGERLGE